MKQEKEYNPVEAFVQRLVDRGWEDKTSGGRNHKLVFNGKSIRFPKVARDRLWESKVMAQVEDIESNG